MCKRIYDLEYRIFQFIINYMFYGFTHSKNNNYYFIITSKIVYNNWDTGKLFSWGCTLLNNYTPNKHLLIICFHEKILNFSHVFTNIIIFCFVLIVVCPCSNFQLPPPHHSFLGYQNNPVNFPIWISMIHLLISKYFDFILRLKSTPNRCAWI